MTRAVWILAAVALTGGYAWAQDAITNTHADEQFVYHAEPRDTLIGLSRRLLRDPRQWPQLQRLNHIVDPTRMPRGLAVHIPFEWLRTTSEPASVAAVSGEVHSGNTALSTGVQLTAGSVVVTGADGSITINLADGSVLTLQPSSVLRLDQMSHVTGLPSAHDARLKLESGRIETQVKPQRDVGRFEISTPVAVTAVRGTWFRDSFDGSDSKARTETIEGRVNVAANNAAVPVAAGFGTRVEQGKEPLAPVPLLPPPDLSALPKINTVSALQIEIGSVPTAAAYRVQLSHDPQFHAIVTESRSTVNALNFPGLADGHYWLRARAIDSLGIEGRDAVTQLEQHALPPPPRSVVPPASARFGAGQARLQWTSMGEGARYRLQIARDVSFMSPMVDRSELQATEFEFQAPSPGQYFWRTATLSSAGEAGAWSAVASFTARPSPAQMADPVFTVHGLQLQWSGIDGERFRLQIARDAKFKYVVVQQLVDGPTLTIPKPRVGTYYARVQAIGPDDIADPFGATREFEVPLPHWLKVVLPLAMLLTLIR